MTTLKNNLLFLFILLILFNINVCNAHDVGNDFSGRWCSNDNNKKQTFTLFINRVSNLYKGGYLGVALGGNRIDDNDEAFSFKASKKDTVQTKIKAGISGKSGIIQLKLLEPNRLAWVILKMPEGPFYVPIKTTLHRCNG